MLSAAKALMESGAALPVDCHLIFTIFEEIGFGASADVYADVSEMVVVDLARWHRPERVGIHSHHCHERPDRPV